MEMKLYENLRSSAIQSRRSRSPYKLPSGSCKSQWCVLGKIGFMKNVIAVFQCLHFAFIVVDPVLICKILFVTVV